MGDGPVGDGIGEVIADRGNYEIFPRVSGHCRLVKSYRVMDRHDRSRNHPDSGTSAECALIRTVPVYSRVATATEPRPLHPNTSTPVLKMAEGGGEQLSTLEKLGTEEAEKVGLRVLAPIPCVMSIMGCRMLGVSWQGVMGLNCKTNHQRMVTPNYTHRT